MKIFVNIPKGFRNDSFITEAIRGHLAGVGEVIYNEKKEQLSGAELADRLRDCDVLMTGWGQPLIKPEDLGSVKLIVHTGGTVGGIVDMTVFETDVTVISGNSHYAESVSEGVLAYMLYALRKMGKYEREMRKGKWDWSPVNEGLLDKKIGIISYGAISSRLIPKLRLFTDSIKVYSTHQNTDLAKKVGFTYATLEEIFSTCEVVSVHTAKNSQTYHMINKKHFDLLSCGALFINTSRGAVIDEQALVEALKTKKFTALLDVYEKEPLPLDNPLYSLDNVILFPHMAGPTYDRREKITDKLIDDIVRFGNGEAPLCVITKEDAERMTVA